MVPATYVVLERLPLLPNGKVDRRRLPRPESSRGRELVLPRTAVEEALVAIWAKTLRLERISVEDDFFDLGGHSLMTARVCSEAEAIGFVITPRDMFRCRTIAALARDLDAPRRRRGGLVD
jgi:hypothetical protein